jgi:hypothetical protein
MDAMGIARPGYYLRVRRERARAIHALLKALFNFRRSRHAARAHCAA